MGDADVADAPLRFPFTQGRQMGLPIEQVVDLHQVDTFGTQQTE